MCINVDRSSTLMLCRVSGVMCDARDTERGREYRPRHMLKSKKKERFPRIHIAYLIERSPEFVRLEICATM